ncbi:MAG TPA: hypothetical protein VFG30_35740 [Polyangiales bacterium]|nr:hypothetical protein [Polyangiales bacterium]
MPRSEGELVRYPAACSCKPSRVHIKTLDVSGPAIPTEVEIDRSAAADGGGASRSASIAHTAAQGCM